MQNEFPRETIQKTRSEGAARCTRLFQTCTAGTLGLVCTCASGSFRAPAAAVENSLLHVGVFLAFIEWLTAGRTFFFRAFWHISLLLFVDLKVVLHGENSGHIVRGSSHLCVLELVRDEAFQRD